MAVCHTTPRVPSRLLNTRPDAICAEKRIFCIREKEWLLLIFLAKPFKPSRFIACLFSNLVQQNYIQFGIEVVGGLCILYCTCRGASPAV